MARTPDETKKPARRPAAKPRAAEAPKPRARAAAPAEAPARTRVAAKPRAEAPKPRGRAAAAPAEAPSRTRTPAKPRAGKPAAAERPAPPPAKAKPRASTAVVRAAPKERMRAAPKERMRAAPQASPAARAKPAPTAKPASPRRRRAAPQDPGRLERLVEAARKSLDDDKAENIVILDVTNRASYADRLVIATGLVGRQIDAMAAHLDEALAAEGLKLRRNSISKSEDWVLIDAGDLIIHLFTPEGRLKFDLEKMWGPDSPLGDSAPGEHSPI